MTTNTGTTPALPAISDATQVDAHAPYGICAENYKAGRDEWVEVNEAHHDEALEVMPPIYVRFGFMVGEPLTHDANGQRVFHGIAKIERRMFARCMTVADWSAQVARLVQKLAGEGAR